MAQLGLGMGIVGLIGYVLLPFYPLAPLIYASVLLFASGEGIFTATQGALLSLAAPADQQGRVQGGAQAFSALSQVIGPLSGGQLYSRVGPSLTFGTGAALVLVALGVLTGKGTAGAREAVSEG
ncbi:MFS transporter [Deinococcus cavernae]|uniref:MFS transporter n=1 Tax=Deinococcus cavernae TaxID=2320857 RepID=UPI001F1BC012|nr:MFS transporter [Deinococcus cavernae]